MNLNHSIFTITCVWPARDGKSNIRCWGYYFTFNEAERVILNNDTDIFECGYYTYAVIEEIRPGLLIRQRGEWWYRYKRINSKDKISKCKKPKELIGTICFGLG